MINETFHFSQKDLKIRYFDANDIVKYDSTGSTQYIIILFISGRAQIKMKNKIYMMQPGDIFLANEQDIFSVEYGKVYSVYTEIRFSPQFYKQIDPVADVLQAFLDRKSLKIIQASLNDDIFSNKLKDLITQLKLHKSKIYVLGSFIRLLCEINDIYEIDHPQKIIKTDSNFAKLMAYIDAHLCEQITLKSVSENIFISPRCITNNCRKITGYSFHGLISKMRIEKALKIIKSRDFYSMSMISSMCGFENYTTFYRTFKRITGMPPDDYYKEFKNLPPKS